MANATNAATRFIASGFIDPIVPRIDEETLNAGAGMALIARSVENVATALRESS